MMNLQTNKSYVCEHCKAKFTKEKTLFVHMCEQKRRHIQRNEKHVLLGYQTYIKFYEKAQRVKKQKTYDEFAKSPYYNAFVKFGSFLSNVNPLYPEKYIEFVVTSGVKLDHWCRESLYESYVLDLIKTEPVEVALQRSITTMQDWAENNNAEWHHYFKYVNMNRAMFDIKDGKISPWIALNSVTGKTMLEKFNDEQLNAVAVTIDPKFWIKKFANNPADIDLVKQVVRESQL